jgi:CRP-like cAMP-binding protein
MQWASTTNQSPFHWTGEFKWNRGLAHPTHQIVTWHQYCKAQQKMKGLEPYLKSYFGIDANDVEKAAALFKLEALPKGEFFLKAGRFSEKLSFIETGIIRMYGISRDKEITQWIACGGSFVVDLHSFIFQIESRWHMQALSECRLYSIYRKDYDHLKKTIDNWVELEKRFITRCFAFMEDRIFSHLSMTAEERYNQLFSQQPELFNQVQQQYLATMLGITPETLSRLRKKIS